MSEIPEDIMTAAEIALCNSLCHDVDAYGGSYEDSRLAAIKDIAAAILAERERCALVALCHADDRPRRYGMDWNDGYMDACKGAHDAIIASHSKT